MQTMYCTFLKLLDDKKLCISVFSSLFPSSNVYREKVYHSNFCKMLYENVFKYYSSIQSLLFMSKKCNTV